MKTKSKTQHDSLTVVEEPISECQPKEGTAERDTCPQAAPRGRPVSGRPWKNERTTRYSEIKRDKPLKSSWQRKMKEKNNKKIMKLYEKELQDARSKELEDKRKRQEEHKKRKEENQRKSEVVQPIKNTAKIKRMKKKQLRKLEKR